MFLSSSQSCPALVDFAQPCKAREATTALAAPPVYPTVCQSLKTQARSSIGVATWLELATLGHVPMKVNMISEAPGYLDAMRPPASETIEPRWCASGLSDARGACSPHCCSHHHATAALAPPLASLSHSRSSMRVGDFRVERADRRTGVGTDS